LGKVLINRSAPPLDTPRLRLRGLDARCTAMYLRFYGDAEASAFYGGPLDDKAAWTRLAADIGVWQLQGFGVWAIERREDSALLGVCGFWQAPGWPRELTWWLLPEARGAGYAQEASQAVLRCACTEWGWPAVETYMPDDNLAARRLVERLGSTKHRRERFPDGVERDIFRLPPPSR
jgi:RimJ/RimL family protein N-acetyltransferase